MATGEILTELIDGVMLGDGHITPNGRGNGKGRSRLMLSQSIRRRDWLENLQQRLSIMGIRAAIYPRTCGDSKQVSLQSQRDKGLVDLRNRWYLDNKKIVPDDLGLTPLVLANWFIGDGTSGWIGGNLKSKIEFCTESFTYNDTLRLQKLMGQVGFTPTIEHRKSGWRLNLSKSAEVNKFFEIVEPFLPKSCQYKIKKPLVRSSSEAALQRWAKARGE